VQHSIIWAHYATKICINHSGLGSYRKPKVTSTKNTACCK